MSPIALAGGAGKTSRAVAAALHDRGVPVRPLVHRPRGLPGEVVVDLLDATTLVPALQGCQALHHLAPNVHPDEVAMAERAVEAARRAGVPRVVFHSVMRPAVAAMPHHWAKARAEEVLWSSGLEVTVLQPCAYAQNLAASVDERRGTLRVPYDVHAPFSLVDLTDVGEATARVLTEDGHDGATYELAGPRTTVADLAQQLDLEPVRIPPEEWAAGPGADLPPYPRDALLAMFRWYDAYGLAGSPLVLAALLGRRPTDAVTALQRPPA